MNDCRRRHFDSPFPTLFFTKLVTNLCQGRAGAGLGAGWLEKPFISIFRAERDVLGDVLDDSVIFIFSTALVEERLEVLLVERVR